MYTSNYSSSSPVRTSTFGVGSTNHQYQPSNPINYNSYQTMDDGSTSLRRAHTNYSNSASSLTSIPVRTTSGSKYSNHTQEHFPESHLYKSPPPPHHPSSLSARSYANENENFRSTSAGGNFRSQSYDDLINEQNQMYRSPSSTYNSRGRAGNHLTHGQQQQQQQHQRTPSRERNYDDDLIVKSTDLSASNEQEMLELVRLAFRKYDFNNQRELAGFLKRSADRAFASCWHCIVGRQFSSYVTHEMNGFIYLTKGPLSILLFKSGS